MTLIEILQGLRDGRFKAGDVIECGELKVVMDTVNRFVVTLPNGETEVWVRVIPLPASVQICEEPGE